jgi:protein-tyrosine-phosphatase
MPPTGNVVTPPAFVRLAAHPVRWRLLTELADSDYRVRELVARVDHPQNLVSYHLRLLREGGLVTATRSSHDGRDSYYHLDLDRCADSLSGSAAVLHPALRRSGPLSPPVDRLRSRHVTVLFVCTGNSARSSVAEALLRHRTAGLVTVTSAGNRPKPDLHPHAVRVLRDTFGIDVAGRRPQHLDSLAGQTFDCVITLCDKAREKCPEFARGTRRIHWSIPDPAAGDGTYPAFERAAVEINTRIGHLLHLLTDTADERTSDDRT